VFPTKLIPTTNTLNKHTQQTHATCSFVLSHPPHRTHIHPNSFPAEPKCFRVLFAPAIPPRQTFECGCSLVLASSSSCGKPLPVSNNGSTTVTAYVIHICSFWLPSFGSTCLV
jgi:hypothetical protein